MKTTLNPEINEKLGLASFLASLQHFKKGYERVLKTFNENLLTVAEKFEKIWYFPVNNMETN